MSYKELSKEKFLYQISKLYYADKISQQKLAKMYNVSIATISRALREAEELKIVEFKLNDIAHTIKSLEDKIVKKYKLLEAIVSFVPINDNDLIKKIIGKSAAQFMNKFLKDNMSVGIAWGSSIFEMVNCLEPRPLKNLKVIELIGSVGKIYSKVNAAELARAFSRNYNAVVYFLNTLAILKNKETRDNLLLEDEIKEVLAMTKKLDVSIVSIGSMNILSSVIGSLKIDSSFFDIIKANGAVGDICLRFFNNNGVAIKTDLDDRIIGISLGDFKKIKFKICISGGLEKLTGIKAALESGLIDILITDSIIAENL